MPLPVIGSTFKFGWISNAALMLFLGSIIGGAIQGLSFKKLATVMAQTVINLRFTVVTIVCLISLASVMNYSGMIAALAAGLVAVSGSFYPFFAPLIGAIGTFVTGSDTSSNILFGKLQANVAGQLGMTGSTTVCGFSGYESDWLAAANSAGATGGKMISPQSHSGLRHERGRRRHPAQSHPLLHPLHRPLRPYRLARCLTSFLLIFIITAPPLRAQL